MKKEMKKKTKERLKKKKAIKQEGKQKEKKNNEFFILLRYIILLGVGIFLSLFYKLFLPLTIYPVYYLLTLFYEVTLNGNTLIIGLKNIQVVNACIAGSAYFLLLILNLTISMPLKKRIYSLLFSFGLFLLVNILRIFILSILYIQDFVFFDFTHKVFWYFLSGIFVVVIWFLTIKIFKIKEIPVYSDLKKILKQAK